MLSTEHSDVDVRHAAAAAEFRLRDHRAILAQAEAAKRSAVAAERAALAAERGAAASEETARATVRYVAFTRGILIASALAAIAAVAALLTR